MRLTDAAPGKTCELPLFGLNMRDLRTPPDKLSSSPCGKPAVVEDLDAEFEGVHYYCKRHRPKK